MLGKLLEISVSTSEPLQALEFYRALGFRELSVGDVWSHPYAVVSDGDLCIGLHAYDFDSPSLTFVQANLDQWVAAYRVLDIELAFEKLSSEQFNEIGFVDPGGQMIAVLESRTFSPPHFEDRGTSQLGRFGSIELPCKDSDASRDFWSSLGRAEDTGRLETADIELSIESARTLTCHYQGDPLDLAEFAARQGMRGITVANDERSAVVKPEGGPVFVISGQ